MYVAKLPLPRDELVSGGECATRHVCYIPGMSRQATLRCWQELEPVQANVWKERDWDIMTHCAHFGKCRKEA